MVFVYTVTITTAFILLVYNNHSAYIWLATMSLSVLYYFRLCMDEQSQKTFKLKNGEFFHQIAYLLWMYAFHQQDFIFLVPLILSNVGKVYAIFH
jgi:hypothetical protein